MWVYPLSSSFCLKHPNLFGGSEKLDVSWDKGLYDSNALIAYRRPRPEWLSQQSFVIQVSFSYAATALGLLDNRLDLLISFSIRLESRKKI